MKTAIKIIALAAVAAFAVFSCAPEADLSGINWKDVNSKNDPGKNTTAGLPDELGIEPLNFYTGEDQDNELTLTFPETSDFLRSKGKVEAGMREFLSFHHFTQSTVTVEGDTFRVAGEADTLGAALPYTFVRQNVNVITVKLTNKFVVTNSSVILKIDGTKYTYSGGIKLDLVGRGGGGEAGYDDYFVELPVYVGPNDDPDPLLERGPTGFVRPGNKDWRLNLAPVAPYEEEVEVDGVPEMVRVKTLKDYPVAYLNLDLEGTETAVSAIYTAVANQLKNDLKIQKLENGTWSYVNGATFSYTYDPDDNEDNAVFLNNVTLEDLVPFRVVWEGTAPVKTSANYFGVNQIIKVIGVNTPNGNTADTAWRPAYYNTRTVYGPLSGSDGLWVDGDRQFLTDFRVSVYSKDSRDKNVVIDVLFNRGRGVTDGATTHWLKNYNNDKKTFKDNFKFVYFTGTTGAPSPTGFYNANNIMFPAIKDIEMLSFNPSEVANIGFNGVRITLDPDYRWQAPTGTRLLFFYISPEIGYTDGKTTYGDETQPARDFFKEYPITTASIVEQSAFLDYAAPRIPLTAGVWANGDLPRNNRADWYSFNVIEDETYYIWVNDRYNGRIPRDKTGDVVIGARYASGVGGDIFGSTTSTASGTQDGLWAAPYDFIATETGVVEVRVTPYYGTSYTDGSYVGTYGIVYNTEDTRPGAEWTEPTGATLLTENEWANGNITAPFGGEQWFRFVATGATQQYIHNIAGKVANYYVQVYDKEGEEVGTYGTSNNTITRQVTTAQTYYIRVYTNTRAGIGGTFQVAFTSTATAPKVTVPTGCPELSLGVWKDGSIIDATPEQWYKFDATKNPQYVHLEFGSLRQLSIRVYDKEGTLVSGNIGGTIQTPNPVNRSAIIQTVTPGPGETYYIKIQETASANNRGTYKIMFNENNTAAVTVPANVTTLTANTWGDGNFTMGTREQWYKFEATTSVTNGQYIHASFGTLANLRVQLYDEGGYPVETEATLTGGTTFLRRTLTAEDTYFIKVWPNTANAVGNFRIRFNESSFSVWPPEDCTPLTVNVWKLGNITAVGGTQWFSFEATVTGSQYIHFDPLGTLKDVNVRLYNSGGGPVGDVENLYNYVPNMYRPVTTGGTYYISVTPWSSSSKGGNFQIMFNASATASTPPGIPVTLPISGITNLEFSIWGDGYIDDTTAGSEEQWFTFTATATTHYIHAELEEWYEIYVQLYTTAGLPVGGEVYLYNYSMFDEVNLYELVEGLTVGTKYYMRVTTYPGDDLFYLIAFNSSSTPPPVIVDIPPPPYTSVTTLYSGTWVYGDMYWYSTGEWYQFDVTEGTTYYVFWEDIDTDFDWLDIQVAAYYVLPSLPGRGQRIFDVDNYETNSESFTADRDGTVLLKVYPSIWNEDDGDFGIVFSTSDTRPSIKALPTAPVSHDHIKKQHPVPVKVKKR
jgi:hypothetical protein